MKKLEINMPVGFILDVEMLHFYAMINKQQQLLELDKDQLFSYCIAYAYELYQDIDRKPR